MSARFFAVVGRRLMDDYGVGEGKTTVRNTRAHAKVALCAAALLAGSVVAADAQDVTGIYWATQYNAKVQLVGGGDLPLTPAGKAAYEKNMAGLKDGSIVDQARITCVPDGPVRAWATPYPFEIVDGPTGNMTILHELNHQIRVVRMGKPLPKYEEIVAHPSYNGHSVGRLEGDTLVIETIGFNEKSFLDATGAPHSDKMTTVERVRKINGGRKLEDVVKVTDPDLLTRPVTARFVYDPHPDVRMQDYVCGEPHRDVSQVPGVTDARRARG